MIKTNKNSIPITHRPNVQPKLFKVPPKRRRVEEAKLITLNKQKNLDRQETKETLLTEDEGKENSPLSNEYKLKLMKFEKQIL